MLEPDAQWILPKNLRRQEQQERKAVDAGQFDGGGDFGSYYAFRTGVNREFIKLHAISELNTARQYARGVRFFLDRMGFGGAGKTLLDVGCGIGIITDALRNELEASDACGIDLSEDGVAYGRQAFPRCQFHATSAEEGAGLSTTFDVVHSREVYPLTRTNSCEYQAQFFGALACRLRPGGIMLVTVLNSSTLGLPKTWRDLTPLLQTHGLKPLRRHVEIPRQIVARAGRLPYTTGVYRLVSGALGLVVPGKTFHFYTTSCEE